MDTLNLLIKIGWFKNQNPNMLCLPETIFKYEDSYRLKERDRKKDDSYWHNQGNKVNC